MQRLTTSAGLVVVSYDERNILTERYILGLTEHVDLGFRLTLERHLQLDRGFGFGPRVLRRERHILTQNKRSQSMEGWYGETRDNTW